MNLNIINFGHYRLTDAGVEHKSRYTLYNRQADTVAILTKEQYLFIFMAENEADRIASAQETEQEIAEQSAVG